MITQIPPPPKNWDNRPTAVSSCFTKETNAPCEDKSYQLDSRFGPMVRAINCARYQLIEKNQDYLLVKIIDTKEEATIDPELQDILDDIAALMNIENVTGYGFRPTDHAYRTAKFYMGKLYAKTNSGFPQPSVMPAGEGGIDIEWSVDDNEVMLSCRANPDQEDFIYIKNGDVRYTELDLSSTKLYKHLEDLINA